MFLIHHRLAQQSSLRIGVIEAGNFIVPNSNQLVDTPGGFSTVQSCWLTNKVIELVGQSFTDASLVWQFNTIPQKSLEGNSIFYPRYGFLIDERVSSSSEEFIQW